MKFYDFVTKIIPEDEREERKAKKYRMVRTFYKGLIV